MSWETWANVSTEPQPTPYISPQELQRLERVAVGGICKCRACVCCDERKQHFKQLIKQTQGETK